MPRPKLVSDEDVLAAALDTLAEQGMTFTLSDLARRVGLSRATLIQRFGDRNAILRHIAEFEVSATRAWINAYPLETGAEGLWKFLEAIVRGMGGGEGFSARVQIAALEVRDPALRALAQERYQMVQTAIAERLPEGLPNKETAAHLHAVIAGATMQWVVTDRMVDLSDFVLHRLRWAMRNTSPALI
ncbi:TetR/AcrR family transcriptional regulator (plasmid) [Paracoccus marcusii]|uniref:TetR/AcrR family transcriptional regulator n=1 Tax=Paracoccus marcusii TaxID=59779 RepID=UPI0038B9B51A